MFALSELFSVLGLMALDTGGATGIGRICAAPATFGEDK
jgi:hypothetical protein